MSIRYILRPREPAAAAAAAVAFSGIGLWAFTSYFIKNAHAEEAEPPNLFPASFGTSLRLDSSESLNHNTKRLRFEFHNPNARSGLTLTSTIFVATWTKGRWFPVLRPYTPVSPLDQRGFIDLMVKKYPDGKASTYLHSLAPGDSLYFIKPLFGGYRWTPNQYPHVTLIAGGAGITPIYQLAQGILNNPEDKTNITLVLGVNSDADVLLRNEFEEFEQKFPGRFKAVYTVSNPSEGSPFRKGYVTKDLLKEVTEEAQMKDTKVFVCGPPAMEKALLGGRGPFKQGGDLEQLGYKKEQIHAF